MENSACTQIRQTHVTRLGDRSMCAQRKAQGNEHTHVRLSNQIDYVHDVYPMSWQGTRLMGYYRGTAEHGITYQDGR